MDITKGFQIEEPNIFIRWGIPESELLKEIAIANPKKITDGYFAIECTSLGGLNHMLGFHFEPKVCGQLIELEFFRKRQPNLPDISVSFQEFQQHLESAFGSPATKRKNGAYDVFGWVFGNITITHLIQDRFEPEEHVRIKYFPATSSKA